MAKKIKNATHTFVLLSDGVQSDATPSFADVKAFKDSLAAVNAKLFVIGIGKEHDRNTLNRIASAAQGGLQGTYIDTATGEATIQSAIAKAYEQTLPAFHLSLTSPLKAGSWSVDGAPSLSSNNNGPSTVSLGALNANKAVSKSLRIHSSNLEAPLDLKNVKFTLHVTDPKNRKGQLPLSWNPNHKIDPRIIRSGQNPTSIARPHSEEKKD